LKSQFSSKYLLEARHVSRRKILVSREELWMGMGFPADMAGMDGIRRVPGIGFRQHIDLPASTRPDVFHPLRHYSFNRIRRDMLVEGRAATLALGRRKRKVKSQRIRILAGKNWQRYDFRYTLRQTVFLKLSGCAVHVNF
jgi:hypothetical protein